MKAREAAKEPQAGAPTFDLPGSGTFVEAFHVSAFTDVQRRIHEDFKERQSRRFVDFAGILTVLGRGWGEHIREGEREVSQWNSSS